MSRLSRMALAAAGIALASAGLLTGCAIPASEPVASTETASREASLLASRLCILNDTTKTLPMVREFGPFENSDHHPDPEGPLKPGKTWCTNGYNSTSGFYNADATAEILFTEDGSDQIAFGVINPWMYYPIIYWGSGPQGFSNDWDTEHAWERDLTYPDKSQPQHSYHIRRLDDSEFFKEWLVTVRR